MKLNKYNIFFDIDGTISDLEFSPLKKLIEKYSSNGVIFGINTNRPFGESLPIYNAIGLTGPIVVENGASFKLSGDAPEMMTDDRLIGINKELINILTRWTKTEAGREFHVVVSTDKQHLNDDGPTILITPNRTFTASVYVRSDGKLNSVLLNKVLEAISTGLVEFKDRLRINVIEKSGKITIDNTCINRLAAIREIVYRYFNDCGILIISDSETVSPEFSENIIFAAVKNADPEYKRMCQIVATKDGTLGIDEILEKFSNQYINNQNGREI